MPAALDALIVGLYVSLDDFLGPRHRGARAGVQAAAEGQVVAHVGPVQVHVVRVGEDGLVAVARPEQQQQRRPGRKERAAQFGQSHPVVVTVVDGRGGTATRSFSVAVSAAPANVAPAFGTITPPAARAGAELRFALPATDADVRAAKPVNRLFRIADDEQLSGNGANAPRIALRWVVGRKQQEQFGLQRIALRIGE